MAIANKHWTFEEAQTAHEQARSDNPALSYADPTLPLFQWFALKDLEQQEKLFKQGEKFALMQALCICAQRDLPMPDWVSRAYLAAYYAVVNVRIEQNSWDAVFGTPYPKNSTLSALRKRRHFKFRVFNEILNIRKTDPGTPIDAVLFERVGEKFGLGKTLTEEYYYDCLKWFGQPIKKGVRRQCVKRLPLKHRK
ncbi:MAG TPA: hypothetical protein VFW00_12020 [Rhodocyclaceae bacterium]|nr:hypothetical protein [Rhodocyclaceae bacterium]